MAYRRDMSANRYNDMSHHLHRGGGGGMGGYNDNMGGGMGGGGVGSHQAPMNPWNDIASGGGGGMNQHHHQNSTGGGGGGVGGGGYNDSTTLLLANNLINNLIRNSNKMLPSLLDVNPMPPMNNQMNQRGGQSYGGVGGGGGMRQGGGGGGGKMYPNRGPQQMSPRSGGGNRAFGQFRDRQNNRQNNARNNSSIKKTNQFKKGPGQNRNRGGNSNANKSKPNTNTTNKKQEPKVKKEEEKKKEAPVSTVDNTVDSTVNNSVEKTSTEETTKVSPKKNIVKSEYDGIDKRYFKCHICKKSMWDGITFKRHLKGHAHLMMMESLSDSYVIKGQLIRHEIRVAENKRQIESERKRRLGKGPGGSNKQAAPVFCTMCDTQFTSTTLVLHRHSSGHMRLKKFLHPKCHHCDKEFATRIEWDEHLLSANHKRKLNDLGVLELCSEEDEQAEFTEQCEAAGLDMVKLIVKENKTDKKETKDTSNDKESSEIKSEESTDQKKKDDKIYDYSESTDLSGVTMEHVPRYDPNVQFGQNFVREQICYFCSICHLYFTTSEASAVHMKTLKHFDGYVKGLKKEINSPKWNPRKTKAEETSDESGDAKRRKTDMTNGEGEGQNEGDMYDPSDCTDNNEEEIKTEQDEKVEEQKETEIVEEKKSEENGVAPVVEEEPKQTTEEQDKTLDKSVEISTPVSVKTESPIVKQNEETPKVESPVVQTKPEIVEKELTISVEDIKAKVQETPVVKKPVNTPSRNVARGGPRSRRGTPRRY